MPSYDPIEDYIEDKHRINCVLEFLCILTPREQEVIKFRWGYDLGYHDRMLSRPEVAKQMGISLTRVRQIEMKTFSKFKRRMKVRRYKDL